MTTSQDAKAAGQEQGRESAQRTYDRRRARNAADTLAQIPPNRWDDHTRSVIMTLATISAPSRIDDALEAFDGEPADHLVEITPRLFSHEPIDGMPPPIKPCPDCFDDGGMCDECQHAAWLIENA